MPSRIRCAGNGASKSRPASRSVLPAEPLTPREEEVVRWIAAGKRNNEIASILECSHRTIESHVHNIFKKLHVETRTNICGWWYEQRQASERSPDEIKN